MTRGTPSMSRRYFSLAAHPYITARDKYFAGRIPSTQAIGMVASDRDFIAESELAGLNPVEAAREIVLKDWRAHLVRRVTSTASI